MAKFKGIFKKYLNNTLFGFSGLILVLNAIIFPQALDLGVSQKEPAPVESKTSVKIMENPVKEDEKTSKRVIYVTVTAYSSTPDQTDDSPFITANGSHVRDGIIAANFLKFGTKVRFPEFSGDKVYEVTDRMNPRYPNRADIWMATREQAIRFGIRQLKMEIL
ncbi:MAG: hypothetical protein WC459_02250 [Patescibacteria group bacterium]